MGRPNILTYILNTLLGCIGFLLVASFNSTHETLVQLNKEIVEINKGVASLKIELVDLSGKMMTEERVRELIRLELMRRQ